MTNDWSKLSVTNFEEIENARKQLHQAVQLAAMIPRSFNPEDAGDKYGSLTWSDKHGGVVSQPFGENLRISLSFTDFSLSLLEGDNQLDSLELAGQTFEDAIEWMAGELGKRYYDSEKISAELPYEIPSYDTALEAPFELISKDAHHELFAYFSNTSAFLTKLVSDESRASDIKCWPHHFDIATLITLEQHEDPEEAKSIGIGLSPGDENSQEPYFYITPWPYPTLDHNALPNLEVGHWQEEGWTGLLIKASEILEHDSADAQKKATLNTLNTAHQYFEKLLTT